MVKYFISYLRAGGHGNGEVECKEKISTMEHIKAIEEAIEENSKGEVVITNYIILSEDR